MKYLTGEKMTFGYAKGNRDVWGNKIYVHDPDCPHTKKVYLGRWVCERCGKELADDEPRHHRSDKG
jgi:hypothetical protein